MTGLIEVHIESSLGGAPAAGAANIGEIRLDPQGATWTGNVVELYITGELGVNGPTLVRNMSGVVAFGTSDEDITIGASLSADITASAITGDIDVGLFFLSNGSITVSTLGNATVDNDLAGDITINGNYGGTITAGDVVGADALIQTVDGDFSGTMSVASTSFGQVNIDGNMSGTIAFDGANTTNSSLQGSLTIDGDLSGTVSARTMRGNGSILVNGDLSTTGKIAIIGRAEPFIAGDLTEDARIKVVGNVTSGNNPPIHVLGSILDGTSPDSSRPFIEIGGALQATIAINGTLQNGYGASHEIVIGSIANNADNDHRGAVAIDYDANGLDDPTTGQDDAAWRNGATVLVGVTEYERDEGNTQSIRVWNVRDCKGDMNSDGSVESENDPDAFDTALDDPTGGTNSYEYLWAGLEASRVWHGDCNFIDGFTSGDQAAFNQLVAHTCCTMVGTDYCVGDVDHDYDVDLTDLAVLLSNFGSSGTDRRHGDVAPIRQAMELWTLVTSRHCSPLSAARAARPAARRLPPIATAPLPSPAMTPVSTLPGTSTAKRTTGPSM